MGDGITGEHQEGTGMGKEIKNYILPILKVEISMICQTYNWIYKSRAKRLGRS